MPTKSLCDATQVARKMKDAMLLGLFFCLPITAARPVDPRFFDIDGLAAQVGGIMEKELTFLQGSFGVVLMIGTRFFIWPIFKKYGWPLMRKWFCCNAIFPPKPKKNISF
jgi:hypothetical protein